MTLDGRITDAMTVLAIQRAALLAIGRRLSGTVRPWPDASADHRPVTADRRDWDAIVVGLGAIGSAPPTG